MLNLARRELTNKEGDRGVSLLFRHAGLLTVWTWKWSFHLLPSPSHWKLGIDLQNSAGFDSWGFGPFLLILRKTL